MKDKFLIRSNLLFLIIVLFCLSCEINESVDQTNSDFIYKFSDNYLEFSVAKWYKNHKAAVSLTYDAAWEGDEEHRNKLFSVVNEIKARKMKIDFECVSAKYTDSDGLEYLDIMRALLHNGIHFYGHGHEHIQYDYLSYDSTLLSMGKCYRLMEEWGLKPKAYAYPGSSYKEQSTRNACKDAGFIGARGASVIEDSLYIFQYKLKNESFLYGLPSIVMGHDFEEYYQNHDEVKSVINTANENESWIIFMYHNIGLRGRYAWYEWKDFIADLELLEKLDFWYVNLDDAICYIQERNNLIVKSNLVAAMDDTLKYNFVWSDNLNNSIYDHPISFRIELKNDEVVKEVLLNDNSNISIININGAFIDLEIYPDEEIHLLTILCH